MELEEGEGESAPPPKGLDIYERLVEIGNEEALANPGLRELLDAHFSLLPPRYGEVMKFDRAEDVLLHRKILEEAKDPKMRPAFHIRFIKPEDLNLDLRKNTNGIEDGRNTLDDLPERPDDAYIAGHEIIFSTIDKPKLLSQLSALLSDIGLNIREAHVFSTIDGYSLDVFIVDGWPVEDTDGLHKEIEAKIGRKEGSKLEDWEIDKKLLHMGNQIASGSAADLYHGSYLGQDVAIKVLRPEHLQDTKRTEFAQELMMLREVKHKNVVRFIGASVKSPELCIVTEYMPGGDLYEYLHKHRNVLDLTMLLKFALDVSKGMDYLHQNNIIHRDLKTLNLLMDNDLVVKVADFGVARFEGPGEAMTAETGTYRWMAPEVINHQSYNHKADIFSFGIVLWELATSKLPYDTMTPIQAAIGVRQGKRPELPEKMHPRLSELIQRCWDTDPDKRPSFREITAELEELLKQQTQETGETSSQGKDDASVEANN